MAPPALVNLDNYSDVSFRDTFIRHQNQVAPTANIIQKLYHHVTGNTANLSAAEVVSVDGSQQGQWDLLLSTSANKLNVNTINTATTGTWSANAIMSVRQATTTIRSANVVVNNLTVAGNASHSSLNVSGISNFNGTDFRRFRRLLSGATNSMVEICEVQITRSPFTVELDITDEDSVTKKYLFAVHQEANTNNQFQRLLPLSATDNGKIHVEMRLGIFNSSRVTFRLVRTELDLTSSTPVDCHFKICHDPAFPVIFHELSETSIVTPATAIYSGTALTQVDGSVGINKSDPAFPLDVVGAANVSGSLAVAGNVAIDTNTLVVDSVANRVGILTATPLHPLDVTGDINSTGSLRINNTQVLSATALGSGVVSSSLTSVGILSSLDVTGAATVGSMGVGGVLTAGAIAAASLTASGNVSAANLTGTIRTTAQPIITSVGTLTSLAVAGNVAIDTNTLVVNSVANRVGIATTTPLHPLDVTGNINSTGSLLINNTRVLSATALGSGVQSSNLTSVGTLTSLNVGGNLTVSGPVSMTSSNNTFDSMVTISLTRTITGNTVGSGVSIGRIGRILSSPDGSSMIELRVISNSGNNMTSKSYEIPHNTDIGISGTRRVIARSGISLTNEVGIDAIRTEDKLDLKLVRTRVDSSVDPGTFHISLIIHYDKGSTFTLENAWTPSTTTYTSTLPEVLTGNDYYPGSSIVQSSGFVGIRVENPIFPLDVGGDAAFRGSLFALETGHKIDCENYYSANVMINTTTVLSGALVGNIFCGGSFTLDITLNHFMNDNNTVSKTYTIPVQKGIIFNGGNWARALPTNATVTTNSGVAENDIDLDIRTPDSPNINGDIRLAIVRSRASASVNTTSPICVSIVARYNKFASQMTFGRETGTYTGFAANNTNIAVTTLMTSCAADGIGIYCEPKDSPYWFDVDSPTTTAASNFRTSLNLDTTRTNRCFLSFGNMWRLFYNTNTQNLEIHKNSNPNDPFWGTFTVTGILAAQ